jgi:aldehyde dehydrogenase (NAD+)
MSTHLRENRRFFIGGQWVDPAAFTPHEVINPATEDPVGVVALGDRADVDRAVRAARLAFASYARTTREDRSALLERIIAEYRKRRDDLARAISDEMGAPLALATNLHAMIGQVHLKTALGVLRDYPFEERRGGLRVVREPIGVCAFITPWNWPINQIAAKVAPALACGCTMVLKPSELSPFSATIWTEILEAAQVPPGVFNLIHGTGPTVGAALAAHPEVDMVSFTGSTRAGIDVAQKAAPTIKRVHQELGGKSANILLPDADLPASILAGVRAVMMNSGQSCNAPTRMLVPASRMAEALELARAAADSLEIGDPRGKPFLGPVVSRGQFEKIQDLIRIGIEQGATLAAGGLGRPPGLSKGFYVRATVFGNVCNDMTIAREEIFGPVLAIIGYDSVDEAITIANDSPYGIAGYIQGKDPAAIDYVASSLRVGQVVINQAPPDPMAPFGGYKQSGNGREWGDHAFEAYLELKAVLGGAPAAAESAHAPAIV